MRFIFGVLVGICLTIGVTYVADAMVPSKTGDVPGGRHMVNWDVVSGNIQNASTSVQEAWARLVGKAKELDRKTSS